MHHTVTLCSLASFSALLLISTLASASNLGSVHLDLAGHIFPRQVQSLPTFNGALAGIKADEVTQSTNPSRQFALGDDTFTDYQTAGQRACDNQHNSCAQAANNGTNTISVNQCDEQSTQCKNAVASATQTAFAQLTTSNAEFDFFCDP